MAPSRRELAGARGYATVSATDQQGAAGPPAVAVLDQTGGSSGPPAPPAAQPMRTRQAAAVSPGLVCARPPCAAAAAASCLDASASTNMDSLGARPPESRAAMPAAAVLTSGQSGPVGGSESGSGAEGILDESLGHSADTSGSATLIGGSAAQPSNADACPRAAAGGELSEQHCDSTAPVLSSAALEQPSAAAQHPSAPQQPSMSVQQSAAVLDRGVAASGLSGTVLKASLPAPVSVSASSARTQPGRKAALSADDLAGGSPGCESVATCSAAPAWAWATAAAPAPAAAAATPPDGQASACSSQALRVAVSAEQLLQLLQATLQLPAQRSLAARSLEPAEEEECQVRRQLRSFGNQIAEQH